MRIREELLSELIPSNCLNRIHYFLPVRILRHSSNTIILKRNFLRLRTEILGIPLQIALEIINAERLWLKGLQVE